MNEIMKKKLREIEMYILKVSQDLQDLATLANDNLLRKFVDVHIYLKKREIDENKISPGVLTWLKSLKKTMGLEIEEAIENMVTYITNSKLRETEFQEYYSSL